MKKTPIWWTMGTLVVSGILVCIALVWIHQCSDVNGLEDAVTSTNVSERGSAQNGGTNDRGVLHSTTTQVGFERKGDLLGVCPDPQADLSMECRQTLDGLFLDRPLGFYSEFVAIPDPLTYRRIFTDPASDRALVLEALQHKECRLEEGDLRLDLKESCHGEAFAKFASFVDVCDFKENRGYEFEWFEPHPIYDGKSRFEREINHIEQYRETEPDGYLMMKKAIWSDVLESRWLQDKCLQYDMSQLGISPESKEFNQLERVSLTLTQVQTLDPATTLAMMAARLGKGWSLETKGFSPVLARLTDSYGRYVHENHPWLRKLSESLNPFYGRDQRLRAAIEVIKSLQDIGWELNLDKLVVGVCGNESFSRVNAFSELKLPSASSCREALGQLNVQIPPSKFRELKILDELERIALELGVYDSAPK